VGGRRFRPWWLCLGLLAGAACSAPAPEPVNPTWADVAPIFRGECNGCHGWNSGLTGAGYRFDFYDVDTLTRVCGTAAQAINPMKQDPPPFSLAHDLGVPAKIGDDVVAQPGQKWARMPPQPSPALPNWERDMLERWAANPSYVAKQENQPPTITLSSVPATASDELDFIAVQDDPDGDSVLGVIEVNGLGFFMNRSGSFAVSFDTSTWPAGSYPLSAVLCDGWTKTTMPVLGSVQIAH
jgi:hypothetical protein